MINRKRYRDYIKVINDERSISLLSSVFFLILTVLVISYTYIEVNTTNIVSMIIICGLLVFNIKNYIINNNKLIHIKSEYNKYNN